MMMRLLLLVFMLRGGVSGLSMMRRLKDWRDLRESKKEVDLLERISRLKDQLERLTDDELDTTKASGFVHQIDRAFYNARRSWVAARPLVKIAVGLGLVVHGFELPTTVLFAHAWKELCLPQLQEATTKVEERWQKAYAVAQNEAPTFRKMKIRLKQLEKEANDVRAALGLVKSQFDRGQLDARVFRTTTKSLRKELSELAFAAYRCRAGASSARRVVEALDPQGLAEISVAAWNSIVACVATATSDNAAKVSLGLGVGADVDDGVFKTVALPAIERMRGAPLPEFLQAWTETAVKALTQGAFVLHAFKSKRRASAALAASVLGCRLVVDGLRQRKTPFFQEHRSPGVPLLTTALTAMAVTKVTTRIPFVAHPAFLQPYKAILAPLFYAESLLNRISPPPVFSPR